ncbi:MAG TPA: FecR domain-containing protein, partial [Chthonomonadaceae bacterium]|nr:FecR domain-containing protein [Chthonomonadaceae bacterium]
MQRPIVITWAWFVALISLAAPGRAQQAPDRQSRVFQGTALVLDVYGPAQSRVGDKGDWKNVNAGDILAVQTAVKTGDNAAVLLKLNGAHLFRVGEKTTVTLKELGVGKSFSFQVLAGNIWSIVRKVTQPAKYEVETPSVVAGVSGTIFAVSHD